MVFNPEFRAVGAMIRNLAAIEAIKHTLDEMPFTGKLLASLRQTAMIKAVHYSTQIEGNPLSESQVAQVIENKTMRPNTHSEKEIAAYYKAFNYMEKAVANRQPFTHKLICALHALVENTGEKSYRTMQNAIYNSATGDCIYLPPEAIDVPILMDDLCLFVQQNTDMPIPLLAGIVHYQFATIHPFMDGNGRTARLLSNYIMRANGYGLQGIYALDEYYATDLNAYYNALQTHPHHNYYFGRETADITPWLEYFVRGMRQAFEKIQTQARHLSPPQNHAPSPVKIQDLDITQRKILPLFTQYTHITTAQIASELSLSPQSTRYLLRQWTKSGFLTPSNPAKKSRLYRLSDIYTGLI